LTASERAADPMWRSVLSSTDPCGHQPDAGGQQL